MSKAKKFVLKHFQEIIEGEEFITISEAKLIEIISSDDLELDKEETVFHACLAKQSAESSQVISPGP